MKRHLQLTTHLTQLSGSNSCGFLAAFKCIHIAYGIERTTASAEFNSKSVRELFINDFRAILRIGWLGEFSRCRSQRFRLLLPQYYSCRFPLTQWSLQTVLHLFLKLLLRHWPFVPCKVRSAHTAKSTITTSFCLCQARGSNSGIGRGQSLTSG